MYFISFTCLIVLARTSNTMWNRVMRVDICELFLILGKGKSLFFPIDWSVICEFFHVFLYEAKEVPFYSWFVECLYHDRMLNSVNVFSAFPENIGGFVFYSTII